MVVMRKGHTKCKSKQEIIKELKKKINLTPNRGRRQTLKKQERFVKQLAFEVVLNSQINITKQTGYT